VPTALLRLRADEQLVALFRSGNDEAFRVIHDRYRARLFAYTRQMLGGSRAEAEDALQDVFLRAYNALRADDRPIALRAWLYRVAHNRCIDTLRRPVPRDEDVIELSRGPLPDPMAEAERRDDLRRLVADVQRLPEQQRSALLMRELEGLTYADLAAALDASVPAVKSLLVRARIGLVEAAEARDTACADIRRDLAASFDRGVRASGKARRHLRECDGCRTYRSELRGVQRGLAALAPGGVGPLALAAKLLGLGGGAGSAAAGGTAIIASGGGAAMTSATAKVVAVVAAAALTAGGAVEIEERVREGRLLPGTAPREATPAPGPGDRPHASPVAAAAGAPSVAEYAPKVDLEAHAARRAAIAEAARAERASRLGVPGVLEEEEEPISPHAVDEAEPTGPAASTTGEATSGGAEAPVEEEPAATGEPTANATAEPGASEPAATAEPAQPTPMAAPPVAPVATEADEVDEPAASETAAGPGAFQAP